MSQVHKVIVLNKPFKIFEMTIFQLLLLVVSVVLGFIIISRFPKEWKFNNVPAGVWAFVAIVGLGIALGQMSALKPWAWWRNLIVYRLGLSPRVCLPKPEQAPLYPDPNIIEPKKRTEEFYVEA